ncbi:MAG: DegV family protein [Lachnospiraceae bacterium]|nr:DegV family protein [Lachnospiraceae bacterium]
MRKIAIVTDSNSGISQKEAEELGVYVIPMPFTIDGDEYFEDINLTVEQFYEKLLNDADIYTSQPTPTEVTKLWDKLLEEYDDIVHIPMSSGLSGACQSAWMLAQDYGGKVQVVDNQRISVTLRQAVLDALALIKKDKTATEIKEILENDKLNSSIYINMETLKYLKKGGRITPSAAALGTLLKIKPVLQIQGEKLDSFAKARTSSQGKSIMVNAMKNDETNRFDNNIHIFVAHSHNLEAAEAFKEELKDIFHTDNIYISELSLSVACHIGPGALALACCKKMDYDNV